jgi:small subunit ribosomal protein S1
VSWETLEVGQIVEGTVTGMNKGGLELQIKNMRAFMPAGQVDVYFHKDISNFIGERWTVEVTRVDREKKNLIVSRRVIIEREKQAARDKLMAELAEGQVRRGVVRSVMDYGAFVDLGGVDGLVHVSELAHRRVRHASEVVKEGDLVDVKIVKLDKETGKVSLSLRQALADPWAEAATRYAVGTPVTARVARIENFGAFLDVEEGVDGLLPVSEISYQRIRHPSDVLQVGQTVKVVVLNIDPAQHKLSFSLKQAGPDPWQEIAQKFAAHSIVGGKVTRVVDFGAFVELEPGVEGLVHISELAPQRVKAASDIVKPGQEVKVRVLEVESEKRRIALSIKRAVEPKPPPPPTPEQLAAQKAAALKREKDQKRRAGLRGGLDF